MTVLEKLQARVSGESTCVATQTTAPVHMRALNDVAADTPVMVMTHLGTGVRVLADHRTQLTYRRVGALLGHEGGLPVVVEPPVTLPPPGTGAVVKWPDERRDHPHPRDRADAPQ